MSTLEDVFYLYERNSRFYYQPNIENSDTYLISDSLNQDVNPFTIGDQDIPCDFKIKFYIKPGEDCPICFDKIMTKSSAFITPCGHHFHKKCLFKYIQTKWESSSYNCSVKCPMCRCSLGHPDFIQRYRSNYFSFQYSNDNKLDKLEDFWLSHEYRLPEFCSNRLDHYLGCNNNCIICKKYRHSGLLIIIDKY